MRVIFYSALQSAPSTKKNKTRSSETRDSESLDDTEKVLEELKRTQTGYNDDNLELTDSPGQLNRFGALQVEEDAANPNEKSAEINLNPDENDPDEDEEDEDYDDDDDEEDEEEEDNGDEDQESVVEQIRDEIFQYEQLPEEKKKNLSLVVNREELIHLLKCSYTHETTARENILTIGMVSHHSMNLMSMPDRFCSRSGIRTWVKVRRSTRCCNTRKSPSHRLRAKRSISKSVIFRGVDHLNDTFALSDDFSGEESSSVWLSWSCFSVVRLDQRWINNQWYFTHWSNARLYWPRQPDILFCCSVVLFSFFSSFQRFP